MSIVDRVVDFWRSKAPEFLITSLPSGQPITQVSSKNYFEQYEMYTYRAIRVKADALTQYAPKLYQKRGDEVVELLPEKDALLSDLYHFNPYMTLADARRLRKIHLDLTGKAYWLVVKGSNNHKYEFYPLDPMKMSLEVDALGLPKKYVFRDANGQQHPIEPAEVIVFTDPDPKNWLQGHSVLDASRYPHNTLELAMKFNMNVFGNMGRPDGFLTLPGISSNEQDRVEEKLKVKYGGVRNAGKTGVLNVEAKWLEIAKSHKDLDWVEGIREMRDMILSIHGVPKILVGLEDSTYANAEQAQRVFQQYTLKPALESEAGVLNKQLLPLYYGKRASSYYFTFDDPVEIDRKANAETIEILLRSGAIKRSEAREELGYDVDPKVDDVYMKAPVTAEASRNDENVQNDSTVTPNLEAEEEESDDQIDKAVDKVLRAIEKAKNKDAAVKENKQLDRVQLKAFFEEQNIKEEKRYIKRLTDYLAGQEERILGGAKALKAPNMNIDLSVDTETKIAIDFFSDFYEEMAIEFNDVANEVTGGQVEIQQESINQVQSNIEKFFTLINETTKKDLQKIIAQAVQDEIGMQETRDMVRDLFEHYVNGGQGVEESRVEAIARTEVNRVKNYVARRNYAQNEAVTKMEWLSAGDAYVREAHVIADGQQVPKGAKFSVGGEYLTYPGDPDGSAENTINCRCSVLPIVEE